MESMSESEKKEYEDKGDRSPLIPLYFTSSGLTYDNALECYNMQRSKFLGDSILRRSYERFSDDPANGNGGMIMMNALEQIPYFQQMNCASVCDYIPLFYSYRKIYEGRP